MTKNEPSSALFKPPISIRSPQPLYQAKILQHIEDIPRDAWNKLWAASPGATPFMRWEFLQTLEDAGCVTAQRGWGPVHLTLWTDSDTPELVAAAPAYVKMDSMGDFSRDWAWTRSFQVAQVPYYPKMVIGVPFSPVTGRRFLLGAGQDPNIAIPALMRLAEAMAFENGFSSIQVLYHHPDEAGPLKLAGLSPRISFQFHWYNKEYRSRDDFLKAFKSKRRNQLKREWRAAEEQGVNIQTIRGDTLKADWELWGKRTHGFYKQTVQRFMWGNPYLNQAFFEGIFKTLPDNMQVVAATDKHGEFIAGAFNVCDEETLWGRYWGGHEHYPFLHFNVCFYHSIEESIHRGIKVFEGGEGGQHKLKRGFEPSLTYHAFKFISPRMARALDAYLVKEGEARLAEFEAWKKEAIS